MNYSAATRGYLLVKIKRECGWASEGNSGRRATNQVFTMAANVKGSEAPDKTRKENSRKIGLNHFGTKRKKCLLFSKIKYLVTFLA